MPFYLFARAAAAWTPHPSFFPDDAFYARLCLPDGLALYWHDFGLYRILTILPYALLNRAVMRAGWSPALLALSAVGLATLVLVWASIRAGLSGRRGALLAGVLLGSPVLLETVNFWSGTLNYALVLLLVAAQLSAGVWARRAAGAESEGGGGAASKGLIVTACGALLALLTYEIALPFVLASSALYVRGWSRRVATVSLAGVACVACVAALAAAGLYWPQRFKLAAEQLTATAPATAPGSATHANNSANTSATVKATAGNANTTGDAGVAADDGKLPLYAVTPAPSASERARMYVSLLFSFIRTGLLRSPWVWTLALALAGMSFLARPAAGGAAAERRLPESVLAFAFALALVACVGYLALTKSMNARYVAFLLIYGAATLVWMKGRVACSALASLLLIQAAVAASLPVHMRDVELAAKGDGSVAVSRVGRAGDLVSIDGRLARASWARRFHTPPPGDVLTRPLNPRACRYSVPCEKCE
ncbi:MAG TPA: hypothetical protein VD835_05020 [Pyrinomonadaceae bacterium]|nr:hypothetical protein [Pyrinomonadaceae bacterium]